jgi:hypothetical protein
VSESSEPVELLRVWDDGEAELIRRLLNSYSIPCSVGSHITHALWPLTVDGLGEIRILVPADQLEAAREILAEHRRHGMEMIRGGKSDAPEPGAEPGESGDETEQSGPEEEAR